MGITIFQNPVQGLNASSNAVESINSRQRAILSSQAHGFGMIHDHAVTLGLITNQSRIAIFGHNPNIGAGASADVWEGGGIYPFPASASLMQLSSSSANDTSAGTGARTMFLTGLDSSYNAISETITMNGVTPVVTANSYLRINTLDLLTVGTAGNSNLGDITIQVNGGGTILGIVRAGFGQLGNCIYSVPAGFVLFVESVFFSVTGGGGANTASALYGFGRRLFGGAIKITNQYNITSTDPFQRVPQLGGPITEKSDFFLRVVSAGQTNTSLNGSIEGVLYSSSALAAS